jgi:hypothetical protein
MVIGYFPNGKKAFQSENSRGLITYGRKHGITRVDLGDCISGGGLYTATYSNGVTCKDTFADPRVMLGFFLNRGFVAEIDCDRTVFNKGSAMGRIALGFMNDIGRNGSMRVGPWIAQAYRNDTQTAMVKFTRV